MLKINERRRRKAEDMKPPKHTDSIVPDCAKPIGKVCVPGAQGAPKIIWADYYQMCDMHVVEIYFDNEVIGKEEIELNAAPMAVARDLARRGVPVPEGKTLFLLRYDDTGKELWEKAF